MEVRLLGEVQLWAAGQLLDVGAPRRQAVLAVLSVDVGRPVAMETLIDRVWDDAPPVEARNVLYSHLSRIRRLLGQAADRTGQTSVRIERRHAGYVLDVDPDVVDLHRFCRLVENGCDPLLADTDRAGALTAALRLWRGPPLAVLSGRWAAQVRSSWHQHRLEAVAQWAQVELRLGHPSVVITALHDLVAEYPLAEPLEGLLMRALHAAGRSAEALDRYTLIRQRLADDLGTDPGPELRTLHQCLLRGEPPPAAPEPTITTGGSAPDNHGAGGDRHGGRPGAPCPHELPPDTWGFTGRDRELDELDGQLDLAAHNATAVVISSVSGTAGVGKTALAVHWAHRVSSRFPDGQLYVNLRGYDPGQPVSTSAALAAFLRSLGIKGPELPEEQADRARLFRSVLAGRRTLVLLDNAHSVEQVVDLLPGTSGCLALVTSRDRLAGLGVLHGAHRIDLTPLSTADADELLRTHVGARVQAEPDAANALITQCAHLPLALRIAAQLAAARPAARLGDLVDELTDEQQRLDLLDAGDPHSSVRIVFSWSYRHLPESAARVFRLLGAHPGREIDPAATAAMADITVGQAQQSLTALSRAHLIQENANWRYGTHDLLHAYATDLARSHDDPPHQRAALTRLFDYYLHTAARAMDRFAPYDRHLVVTIPDNASRAQSFTDRDSATQWLDTERANLVTTAVYAAAHGWPAYTCRLSDILWRYFSRRCHYVEAKTVCTEALRVANDTTLGGALLRYGTVLWRSGRQQQALDHYARALSIVRNTGAREIEAGALINQGAAYYWLKRYPVALTQLQRALTIAQELNDPHFEGHARDTLGLVYQALGRYPEALENQNIAIQLYRQHGEPDSEAGVRGNLGVTYSRLGRYQEAIEHHQHALATLRALGDRRGEAEALNDLATTVREAGSPQQAIGWYQQAITCVQAVRERNEWMRAHDGLAHCYTALGNENQARQHRNSMLALQTEPDETI